MSITTTGRMKLRPGKTSARLIVAGCLAVLTVVGPIRPSAAETLKVDEVRYGQIASAPDGSRPGELANAPETDWDRQNTSRLAPPRASHAIYGHCQLDFNDPSVLSSLMPEVQNGFVPTSGWNQSCIADDGMNISIQPQAPHGHIYYKDDQVAACGQFGLNFGRHTDPRPEAPTVEEFNSWDDEAKEDWNEVWNAWINGLCTEIDPLTEPRRGIEPHAIGFSLFLFAYDSHGEKYQPITIGQLRVIGGASEICHRGAGPVLVAGPTDLWSCVDLEPGNWDLSNTVVNAGEVRITALTTNSVVSDIGIWTSAQ